MEKIIVSRTRVLKITTLLALLLFVVMVIALFTGTAKIEVIRGIKGLVLSWQNNTSVLSHSEQTILFSIRMPRIIFAGIIGAALSTSGIVFQGILRNSLAEPYILGISGGSAVGAMLGIIIGIHTIPCGIALFAFTGACLTVIVVFFTGKTRRGLDSNTLLLSGVIINVFFSAVLMFLISVGNRSNLHDIMFWLMGNLALAGMSEIISAGIFLVIGFAIIYISARSLNLIAVGEETALQLGVDVDRTKKVVLLASSLITAAAVSFSGIIGFVGLIIPHMMRMLVGSDHRLLLPASFFFGASFLIIADTVARTVIPFTELPVGVVTAFFGAPYFMYLLRKKSA